MTVRPQGRVIVTPPMLAAHPALFQPLIDCGLTVVHNSERYPMESGELAACLGDAVAVVLGLDDLSDSVLEQCPQLQIVARNGVGLDMIDIDAATRRGVFVTAPFGANSTSVAELTMGLLIALVRQIVPNHNRVQQGIWHRELGMELAGKTLGIIGLGRIGKKVARRALAFDMRVIAHDILPDVEFARQHGIDFVSRDELLAASDIVTLHVPLTDLTIHMMNQAAFATMKPGAYLLNAARGRLIDVPALLVALDSGHLAGAALDVHTREGTVEPDLLHRPNVITTTHLGAYTHEALESTTRAAVRSIVQYFTHQPVEGLVNPEAAAYRQSVSK